METTGKYLNGRGLQALWKTIRRLIRGIEHVEDKEMSDEDANAYRNDRLYNFKSDHLAMTISDGGGAFEEDAAAPKGNITSADALTAAISPLKKGYITVTQPANGYGENDGTLRMGTSSKDGNLQLFVTATVQIFINSYGSDSTILHVIPSEGDAYDVQLPATVTLQTGVNTFESPAKKRYIIVKYGVEGVASTRFREIAGTDYVDDVTENGLASNAVLFSKEQTLNEKQRGIARKNIGSDAIIIGLSGSKTRLQETVDTWVSNGRSQQLILSDGTYSLPLEYTETDKGLHAALTEPVMSGGTVSDFKITVWSVSLSSSGDTYSFGRTSGSVTTRAVRYDKRTALDEHEMEAARENQSIPIAAGNEDNSSAVLYHGVNNALSFGSVALGELNIAGLKGYYWSYIDKDAKTIYLSEENAELEVTDAGYGSEYYAADFECPYSVGDTYSIHDNDNFYNCGKITAIDGNCITVDKLPSNSMGVSVPYEDESGDMKYYFYVLDKPGLGTVDLGHGASATGVGTAATNLGAHAEGVNTVAYGRYAHAEGASTTAGYCAHAEGLNSVADGENSHAENSSIASGQNSHAEGGSLATGNASHAEGWDCEAVGEGSHVEGYASKAEGRQSHAEGVYTQTKNQGEHAEGKFNLSETRAVHTVGVGTSTTNRLNAHLITDDGKNYIKGLGGYDGYNHESSIDVATAVNNKSIPAIIIGYDTDKTEVENKVKSMFYNDRTKSSLYIKWNDLLIPAWVRLNGIEGFFTRYNSSDTSIPNGSTGLWKVYCNFGSEKAQWGIVQIADGISNLKFTEQTLDDSSKAQVMKNLGIQVTDASVVETLYDEVIGATSQI